MKRIFLLLSLISFTLSAQINVTSTKKTVPKVVKKVIVKTQTKHYDSTYNYPGKNIKLLIGQRFFVKPKAANLQKFGFKKFVIDPNRSEFAAPNIYKHSTGISSSYDALANRYFLLKKIIRTKTAKQALVLYDSIASETVHFLYNSTNAQSFPFLIEGYFKKMVTHEVGKKYILRKLANPIVYLTDGFEAKAGAEKLWEIDKVTLDDKFYNLSYVLKDSLNNQFLVYKDDFDKTSLSEANFDLIKTKYPEKYRNILKQYIATGMSKEACLLALGKPLKIDTDGTIEHWQYKNMELFFKKSVLISYN